MGRYKHNKDLNKVRDMIQGRGLLGWIIRKFFGKKQVANFTQLFDQADDQLSSIQSQRNIAQTGTPAKALVLNIEDTGMLVNNRPVAVLTLRIQPDNAPEYEVKIQTIVSRFTFPRPNDTINIKYNPLNPKEVAIID